MRVTSTNMSNVLIDEACMRKPHSRVGEHRLGRVETRDLGFAEGGGGLLRQTNGREIALLTTALGVVLGVLVSISSIGAGAIGVTALLMLYPKMPTVRIVGTDIAHAVPLTLIAGAGHWWLGSVDWPLLASLLVGSIPGIAIGSHFASRVPDRVLRPLLAGTLALVGGKLVF
jgi:uncharacterized membrane protein YfcA